jgi:hypothetical protein
VSPRTATTDRVAMCLVGDASRSVDCVIAASVLGASGTVGWSSDRLLCGDTPSADALRWTRPAMKGCT